MLCRFYYEFVVLFRPRGVCTVVKRVAVQQALWVVD